MKHLPLIRNTVVAVLLLFLATNALAQPTFFNEIPIPPLIDANNGPINLEMRVSSHKFDPGNPSNLLLNGNVNQPNGITTFCYNVAGSSAMSILGPTLQWYTNETTAINVKNLLNQTPPTGTVRKFGQGWMVVRIRRLIQTPLGRSTSQHSTAHVPCGTIHTSTTARYSKYRWAFQA